MFACCGKKKKDRKHVSLGNLHQLNLICQDGLYFDKNLKILTEFNKTNVFQIYLIVYSLVIPKEEIANIIVQYVLNIMTVCQIQHAVPIMSVIFVQFNLQQTKCTIVIIVEKSNVNMQMLILHISQKYTQIHILKYEIYINQYIQMQKVDYIFKIVLIGSQNVGKSSIMARFIDQVFNDSYLSTVGVDFRIKTLSIQDKTIKMQIWDTAGQERFQALTQSHYKGAHGCIAVYDVTSERSFEDAKKFLKLVIEEHGLIPEACYLIANKVDLINKRVILVKSGSDFAQDLGVNYLETSAKTGDNVNQLFLELGKIILNLVDQKRTNAQPPENDTKLRTLDTQKIEQEQSCKC
ncbi:unnamed protein product [Paramecium sonneborni]|uniref:Uncharacterized protein n=1 Tax=Paramecium sonneborni TaxID=65129 RepID=A0A8S1NX59_9CILI|nr:unnamed protein product [Paramecium sonneborni]